MKICKFRKAKDQKSMSYEKLKKITTKIKIMPKGVKLHQKCKITPKGVKLHQKRKITSKDYSRIFQNVPFWLNCETTRTRI